MGGGGGATKVLPLRKRGKAGKGHAEVGIQKVLR